MSGYQHQRQGQTEKSKAMGELFWFFPGLKKLYKNEKTNKQKDIETRTPNKSARSKRKDEISL